ncbi:MAG: peptide chain release factor N(5)-glutamine methyltransferase [Aquificae bacterium]|nr:peptide chain release factor N(5)-glutamine methyltransferase [Aquificota bacterium]
MKAGELLRKVESKYRRDAEIILAHLLGLSPSQLTPFESVPPQKVREFFKLLEERKKGIPVAYLIGEWECMGRVFKVKEGVLIPRPETEILIEKTLQLLGNRPARGLEIGVGSGCIAVNLLVERPRLEMVGTDISEEALKVARENAELHGVQGRLKLLRGSLFEPVKGMSFDFIVSNPPYIPAGEWEKLPPEVKREGYTSLVGGRKGWEFYEQIAEKAPLYLKGKGFVALEIGHDQGEVVSRLFREKGFKVDIFKDYAGQDRVIIARL